jgi:stearoyl-CoA desaturase (delta-9 desaturase)
MKTVMTLAAAYALVFFAIESLIGTMGLAGEILAENFWLKVIIYYLAVSHLTITWMSLSFHRYHTHRGVIINKYLDSFMQIWLWLFTGMSKLDWVSVHLYHHAHSDQEKDPHSPYQKGFWRVFLFGVADYTKAKSQPDVLKIRNVLPANKLETFLANYTLLGPILLSLVCMIVLGPKWGSLIAALNFSISPLFAVGGVNALAHTCGYRNHNYHDNSRNIGFLFPLNFIICGELDHNNHHAHPRSSSFRHKWYEFDIGYFYLVILNFLGLVEIKNAYTTRTLKEEIKRDLEKQFQILVEKDQRMRKKLEELARELNTTYQELVERIKAYIRGKKVDMEKPLKQFYKEIRQTIMANRKLSLSYS